MTPRVLLAGDSLAVGLAAPLARLGKALGVDVHGAGVSGTTARQWVQQGLLKQALAAFPGPSVVLYSLGTNDMRARPSPSALGADVATLVQQAAEAGASVGWLGPPPMPFDEGTVRADVAAALAPLGVRVLAPPPIPAAQRAGDRVHLTPSGYEAWAAAVAAAVPFDLDKASPPAVAATAPRSLLTRIAPLLAGLAALAVPVGLVVLFARGPTATPRDPLDLGRR